MDWLDLGPDRAEYSKIPRYGDFVSGGCCHRSIVDREVGIHTPQRVGGGYRYDSHYYKHSYEHYI